MNFKPRVLIFNKFYLPGYRAGGPIRTLSNMVDRLGSKFDFYIITTDRDSGDTASYSGIVSCSWNEVKGARVYYLNQRDITSENIASLIAEINPRVIYLNSVFDRLFTLRVLRMRSRRGLRNIPVLLAPRGEFSEGALQIKSFRKSVFLSLSRFFGLFSGLQWHASSIYEKRDILRTLTYVRESSVHEAMNMATVVDTEVILSGSDREHEGPLRVCFLSRISPKKNLDFALKVLANVSADVKFTIYGPVSDEAKPYWRSCEAFIQSLPPNIEVEYGGVIHNTQVRTVLSEHDLFFFPTKGENYGHVIQEALSAGLPILISDQTPWMELTERGVGWAFELSDEGAFVRTIDEVASWTADQRKSVRQKATRYAAERMNSQDVVDANVALFESLIAK